MIRRHASKLAFAALALGSAAAALSALLNGCVLPSFTLEVSAPVDAGHDVAMHPETGPPPSDCTPATYPDPPGGTDDGMSVGTLVFALHSIDLGDLGTIPGYDLDHVCTCTDDAGPSCKGASAQSSTYCDQPGNGIDNQAAKLFKLIQLPVGSGVFGSTVFSAQANAGRWSLLIRVDGYNGQPNDPDVRVAIFPSKGTAVPPTWMGNDTWPVTAASVGDGGVTTPLFKSNGAYVTAGVLVATMPAGELTIQGGGPDTITVRLSAGVITGTLVGPAPFHVQGGVFAGRWAITDVFDALSSYRDNNGKPICTDQITYSFAKTAICDDADILVDGTLPKSAPCDALSIALGFTADPALLGPVADAGTSTPGCPAATDPANDKCP